MPKLIHHITTVVQRVEDLSRGVRAFELTDPDHWDLPLFTPGAHIDVHLPSGRIRQYSLCGDAGDRSVYRIAVQLEQDGRGGSAELHQDIKAGAILPVSLPRNNFPLVDAPDYLLIAGGIGITPFIPMVHALARSGASYVLHYCSKTPEQTAFMDQLAPFVESRNVFHHFSRSGECRRLDIAQLLGTAGSHTHIYCCGPKTLIDAVRDAGSARPAANMHLESFGVGGTIGDAEYELVLARSGRSVTVHKGETMLNALRNADVDVPASCEAGVCLECKTRYLEGTPIHRDIAMKPEDRKAFVTLCVSGCADQKLVLDL